MDAQTTPRPGDNTGGMTDAEQIAANLKEKHPKLVARSAELGLVLERLPAAAEDLDTAERLSETVRQCTTFLKASEATRVEEKEPYLMGERAVDGFFKNLATGVQKTKERAERVRSAYDIAVEERERKRLKEEADKAAQEARDAAAKAVTARGQEQAAVAEERAEQAQQATKATSADLTRTRTGSGVTTSLKTEWRHEVTDAKKVPKRYMVPSDSLIRDAVKAATNKDASSNSLVDAEGNSLIPGVRIYKHRFSQVR